MLLSQVMFCAMAAICLAPPMLAYPYGLSYDAVMKVLGMSPRYMVKPMVFSPTEDTNEQDTDGDQSKEMAEKKTQKLFGLPSYAGLGHFSSGYSGLGYAGAGQG
jgi:hypothetical protein